MSSSYLEDRTDGTLYSIIVWKCTVSLGISSWRVEIIIKRQFRFILVQLFCHQIMVKTKFEVTTKYDYDLQPNMIMMKLCCN